MSYQLYQADNSDVDFMADEIRHAASDQHFPAELVQDRATSAIRKDLGFIVNEGRRRPDNLRAQALILEHAGQRVAFAILSEMFSGQGGNELYVLCVARQHRGNGHGKFILDSVIERWTQVDLYCRCSPASQTMFDMLRRRGFDHVNTMADGYRVLRRARNMIIHRAS